MDLPLAHPSLAIIAWNFGGCIKDLPPVRKAPQKWIAHHAKTTPSGQVNTDRIQPPPTACQSASAPALCPALPCPALHCTKIKSATSTQKLFLFYVHVIYLSALFHTQSHPSLPVPNPTDTELKRKKKKSLFSAHLLPSLDLSVIFFIFSAAARDQPTSDSKQETDLLLLPCCISSRRWVAKKKKLRREQRAASSPCPSS